MGDFVAEDLRRRDGLYPQHRDRWCAGCHGRIDDEDRVYADFEHIWHSWCWPEVDGSRKVLEQRAGRWRPL